MEISSRSLPPETKLTIFNDEPVLGQPGVEKLSPRIASVFARWNLIEKGLDEIFTLISEAKETKWTEFQKTRGWDRRVKMINNLAKAYLGADKQDVVRAVLKLIEKPAQKRHELAHKIWAIAEGFEDSLVLLPQDALHRLARPAVHAKEAGTSKIPVDTRPIHENSALVSVNDLDLLIKELQLSQKRLTALIWGYLYEPFLDETGIGFSENRDEIEKDKEVQERIQNMKRSR